MPSVDRKKDYFQFNKGINTEANEIGFPDGFSTDEQNYELLIDGSRKRRKGLGEETGGSNKATGQTIGAAHAYTTYKWRGVGSDPDKNFIVHQIGAALYFTDDAETISTTYHADNVSLAAYLLDTTTYDSTDVEDSVVQMTQGRGVLIVTGKFIQPFYVEYDATGDSFNPVSIDLKVRDFYGIDDGVSDSLQPLALSADHEYNLRNRGWIDADITTYTTDSSSNQYPAKGQIWHRGNRRTVDVLYADDDGINIFDAAKLEALQFGQASAPQGSLFLNPLDTRYSASVSNDGDEVTIASITCTDTDFAGGNGTFRIVTDTIHNRLDLEQVTLSGTLVTMHITFFGSFNIQITIDGSYTIAYVDTTTFDITFKPAIYDALTSVEQEGQINGSVALPKSDGSLLSFGPTACAYMAGRTWLAGIQDAEWSDTIFFSKIALKPNQFAKCYQEADPTQPDYNQLTGADGGTIVIPNLGQVKRMLPLRDKLLVFSDQGVWEIGGNKREVFSATGFQVRKITEAECSSNRSPVVIGNRAIYTGPRGIHLIAPNQYTSVLEETSLSEDTIQTLWNAIPVARQEVVQTVYDSARKKLYFLYGDTGDNANHYANALVLDLRIGSYTKYVFNTTATVGLLGAYSITDSDSSDSNKKVKWTAQSTNSLITCDLDQTDYLDFDGAESPLPYVLSGWDNIGSFQRRRRAPIITVFAKRTETGYTATGNGYDPVNESSNLLTAYWDWTDDSVSGKIGTQHETYRHTRGFVPSGTTDVDGYPVVTTRNKLRGRGRVLQLRFDGAATKDSHILGFTVNYKVSRRI